jgi:hypothetical protein
VGGGKGREKSPRRRRKPRAGTTRIRVLVAHSFAAPLKQASTPAPAASALASSRTGACCWRLLARLRSYAIQRRRDFWLHTPGAPHALRHARRNCLRILREGLGRQRRSAGALLRCVRSSRRVGVGSRWSHASPTATEIRRLSFPRVLEVGYFQQRRLRRNGREQIDDGTAPTACPCVLRLATIRTYLHPRGVYAGRVENGDTIVGTG